MHSTLDSKCISPHDFISDKANFMPVEIKIYESLTLLEYLVFSDISVLVLSKFNSKLSFILAKVDKSPSLRIT